MMLHWRVGCHITRFLDGDSKGPSSAVFGGLIASEALSSEEGADAALSTELGRGTVANPCLAEFYIPKLIENSEEPAGTPI